MKASYVTILCLFLICCNNNKQETESKDKNNFLKDFTTSLELGDTVKAIELLEKYNSLDTGNIDTKSVLAVLKMERGLLSKEKSYNLIKELHKMDTTSYWAEQFNYARIIEEESSADALKEIDKMIVKYPNEFWNYHERGKKLIELKRYDEAIDSFNKAIEIEPKNRWPYADRALAKYLKGDKIAACTDWRTPGGGAISYYEKYCK